MLEGLICCRETADLEEVVYSPEMSFTRDEEVQLRELLKKPSPGGAGILAVLGNWMKPVVTILTGVSVIIVGLSYFIKPDITALRGDITGLKADVDRHNGELTKVNERIDKTLTDFLNRLLPASAPSQQKGKQAADTRHRIETIPTVIALANDSGIGIDHEQLKATGERLTRIAKLQPEFSEVAWDAMAAVLHYNSGNIALPAVKWTEAPTIPGFPGLFGVVELAHVTSFFSDKRVEVDKASLVNSIKGQALFLELLKGRGLTTWPEYVRLVGSEDSNIVLDRLHLRNAVIEHMNVLYGGGTVILENVNFVNCTFKLRFNVDTLNLSNALLASSSVSFKAAP